MARLTTDRNDPGLGHGGDTSEGEQNEAYLILSEEERAKGFVRPYRDRYVHAFGPKPCHTMTIMGRELSETYARQPSFYGFTYCCACRKHLPVAEFAWAKDGEVVGS